MFARKINGIFRCANEIMLPKQVDEQQKFNESKLIRNDLFVYIATARMSSNIDSRDTLLFTVGYHFGYL